MPKDKRNQIKVDLKNVNVDKIISEFEMDIVPEWDEDYLIRRKEKAKRRLE